MVGFYQNTVYKAASIPTTIVEPTTKPGEHRNIFVSIITVRALFLLLRSAMLITIINKTRRRKTKVIRSINGMSGKTPFVQTGKNLNTVESGIVRMAEVSAAADVVRFQKKPKRKIDRTPGEINPTYSWINW